MPFTFTTQSGLLSYGAASVYAFPETDPDYRVIQWQDVHLRISDGPVVHVAKMEVAVRISGSGVHGVPVRITPVPYQGTVHTSPKINHMLDMAYSTFWKLMIALYERCGVSDVAEVELHAEVFNQLDGETASKLLKEWNELPQIANAPKSWQRHLMKAIENEQMPF